MAGWIMSMSHSAAVLAYGHGLHTLNLFIWRSGEDDQDCAIVGRKGIPLLHWASSGLSYWAVSDAAGNEVAAFRNDYIRATAAP